MAKQALVTPTYRVDAENMWLTYGQWGAEVYALVVFLDEDNNDILDTDF